MSDQTTSTQLGLSTLAGFAGLLALVVCGALISSAAVLGVVNYSRTCTVGGACTIVRRMLNEGPTCLNADARHKIANFGRRVSGVEMSQADVLEDERCLSLDDALVAVCKDIEGGAAGSSVCH